jgi:hypothetical protein
MQIVVPHESGASWIVRDVHQKKMELVLRFVVMPISLVASVGFCVLMWLSVRKWPHISHTCDVLAVFGCVAVSACIAMSIFPGGATMNQKWPLLYGIFYRFCFLIGPPAFATLLIVGALKRKKGKAAALVLPTAACFLLCIVFLVGDIAVYEAAYGPS